jgi:hypothetical protein
MWAFMAKFNPELKENWIYDAKLTELNTPQLYIAAVYFVVTTITTVGYGDISANNMAERLFCSLLMLLGVLSFSFSTGSLANMVSNRDKNKKDLNEKLHTLQEIEARYKLSQNLREEILKMIRLEH